MVVEFTMAAARSNWRASVIGERASRRFFEEHAEVGRPVVLRSNDFFR
jgi:hypothetical protein